MGKTLCYRECNIMNTDNTSQQASNTYFQMSVYHHMVGQG